MKIRIVVHGISLVLLAIFGTGCVSSMVLNNARQRKVDGFYPSAVFQGKNSHTYALYGIYVNDIDYNRRLVEGIYRYLLVPQINPVLYLTNSPDLAIKEIGKLPPDFLEKLPAESDVPAEFIKIMELPKNDLYFEINVRHPNSGEMAFLPFTVIVDTALLPAEIPIGLLMAGSLHNIGHE